MTAHIPENEVGRAADAEAALSASPTAPVVEALPVNDQPRSEFARGLIAAAGVAEKWRDENRAACAKARKTNPDMVELLEGAAIECNAIAAEIRRLAGEA